jgi:hypothetical protein
MLNKYQLIVKVRMRGALGKFTHLTMVTHATSLEGAVEQATLTCNESGLECGGVESVRAINMEQENI